MLFFTVAAVAVVVIVVCVCVCECMSVFVHSDSRRVAIDSGADELSRSFEGPSNEKWLLVLQLQQLKVANISLLRPFHQS